MRIFKYISSIILLIATIYIMPLPQSQAKNMIYPWDCCGPVDCKPVPCDELLEDQDGMYKYKGLFFSKDQIKPSEDNKCHVCIQGIKPMCAFIQLGF